MKDGSDRPGDRNFRIIGLTLTDSGASEFLFAVAGLDEGLSARERRARIRSMAAGSGMMLQGPLAEAHKNLVAFLQRHGGTFSVRMELPEAMDANVPSAMALTQPDKLNLTSSFTGNAPGGAKQ